MNNIILFDDELNHTNLLPLSFTRPIADFRIGITTIKEKWQNFLKGEYSYLTLDYLSSKYKMVLQTDNLFVAGNVLPSVELAYAVMNLRPKDCLCLNGNVLAYRNERPIDNVDELNVVEFCGHIKKIDYLFDLFLLNADVIVDDYKYIVSGRESARLSPTNILIGDSVMPDGTPALFIEPGAVVEGAILNVSNGPIYIGRDAEVMEGSCLRGPIALCHDSHINMGAKVYGGTTIGPFCKIGGEVNNIVVFGYSNKSHDGFLGNAVIGEWCNIGAGVNASNLKNDYSKIRIWNYRQHKFMHTDLQFCGLMMGDHSKIGVNCMLNTATVLGVGVNIHGSGFPRTFIPSFSEGSAAGGFVDVKLKKFFDIASRAMSRRNVDLTSVDMAVFEAIYETASVFK